MRGNTLGNDSNTRGNNDNTRDKSCQLKLNNINCHVNYHVRFGVQVRIPTLLIINTRYGMGF